jgi:hypothetical protein
MAASGSVVDGGVFFYNTSSTINMSSGLNVGQQVGAGGIQRSFFTEYKTFEQTGRRFLSPQTATRAQNLMLHNC